MEQRELKRIQARIDDFHAQSAATRVGGVYIKGAGKALEGLGPLQGLSLDARGRLVLVTQARGSVELPALDLEDVVTIFRVAYGRGQAAYVSIDPIDGDPHGPLFNIRHSKGTEHTRVGWILFEADRLMKVYGLGRNNLPPQQAWTSSIPDYDRAWKANYRPSATPGEQLWTRQWIVPAEIKRMGDPTLMLFHIPLEVKTEIMVEDDGRVRGPHRGGEEQVRQSPRSRGIRPLVYPAFR